MVLPRDPSTDSPRPSCSRERLLPYIYTAHRALYDSGVGVLQPLYYQHPKLGEAYRAQLGSIEFGFTPAAQGVVEHTAEWTSLRGSRGPRGE